MTTAHAAAREDQAERDASAVGDASAQGEGARAGLSLVDSATLLLIAVVVVLVSLPRLRRFALRENETDAVRMLRILADDAVENAEALATGDLGALLAASTANRVRLEDVEIQDDGRLRRHGYLFEIARPRPDRPVLLAWPFEHGRTGLGAFAAEPGRAVVGVANEDGRFSGPDRSPPAPPRGLAEGTPGAWRPVSVP